MKSAIELHVELSIGNGFLGGPYTYDNEFVYSDHVYRIYIYQCGCRKIDIACEELVSCSEILDIYQKIEKLLMMFDGRFMAIRKMEITDSRIMTLLFYMNFNKQEAILFGARKQRKQYRADLKTILNYL